MNTPIEIKPIEKVSKWRRLLSKLPFHCKHCGKKYISCHGGNVNILVPLPQNGKCCPDGHEGYVDEFMLYGTVRHWIDNVNPNN